jgi:hypothetical protein
MDKACSMQGINEKVLKILVRKPKEEMLGRPMCVGRLIIKWNFQKM